jgi:SAM-dependent methyltransferase
MQLRQAGRAHGSGDGTRPHDAERGGAVTAPTHSAAGVAWADTYARRGVWWGRPEELTVDRLRSWAREPWLGEIVRVAGRCAAPGARVLEAGCGTGQYGLALALQACQVDALDVNPAALERAGQIAEQLTGAVCPPTLLEGDLLRLPTPDDAYDLVFNQQVMEYFVDGVQRRAALAEMVRTTRPGGRVVVVVARPAHPFARWWRLTGWPGFTDQPDMIELGARRLEDELRAVGLSDVTTDGIAPWRAVSFWPRWHEHWAATRRAMGAAIRGLEHVRLPRPVRRRFGLQLLAVGTKRRAPEATAAPPDPGGGPWLGA